MSVPVAGSKLVKRPLASDGDEFQAYRNPRLIVKFGFHLKLDRKSTRLNSSHANISYAVFCLKKKTYILHHSNRALPGPYKFAVLWSGQEGSILFWALLLSAYGFVLRLRHKVDQRLVAMASIV